VNKRTRSSAKSKKSRVVSPPEPAAQSGSLHSETYFGPQRAFWWNADFLELLANRWRLFDVASVVVDVGCGIGHWSCLIYRHVRPGTRLICVDKEAAWPTKAIQRFSQLYSSITGSQASGLVGDATCLPLHDNSADLVTCQTLLVHVADPAGAVREMQRIAKPGGLVVCAEPNNLFGAVVADCFTASLSTEDLVDNYEFWLRYERGKAALGLGNNSIGDLLPSIFAQVGLEDVSVYLSDKTNPLLPPYSTDEQKALLAQEKEWEQSRSGPWDHDELKKYVYAGGGSQLMIDNYLRLAKERANLKQVAISDERYCDAGAAVMYVVSGRKHPMACS
jgi:ubiquinone/menaquinone biosynthesis C-methylase UbiE